jgi:HEAT repeat protein
MKIAPGVRLRASSRGFSAGLGPRAARVHVGTRGVGVSTGVGPFGAYSHLGGASRRRSSSRGGGGYSYAGPSRASLAALEREARQAEKAAEIGRVIAIERELVSVHLEEFSTSTARVLPEPSAPDETPIRQRIEGEQGVTDLAKQLGGGVSPPQAERAEEVDIEELRREERTRHLEGVGVFKRSDRRKAKEAADAVAQQRAEAERQRRAQITADEQARLDAAWADLQQRRVRVEELVGDEGRELAAKAKSKREDDQALLDEAWQRLTSNDPATVISALEAGFADNGAAATPIDCEGDKATVTVLYGHPDLIPDRTPALTASGKPTLHKRTKSNRNELYLHSLASNVLATVKEGLAVCPSLGAITVLVVRRDPLKTGGERLAAVYAATFTRDALAGTSWRTLDLAAALEQPADWCLNLKGQASLVAPLDLSEESDLQGVLEHLAKILGIPAFAPKKRETRAASSNRATKPQPIQPDQTVDVPDKEATSSPLIPGLVDQLGASDLDTRYEAITALRERRDPSLIGPLMRAVQDEDRHVRRQAVGALADLSDTRCRATLTKLLDDPDADIRWEAICGLREILDASLLSALRRSADDTDPHVRRAAVGALGELREPSVRDILRTYAADPDDDVRYEAISFLSKEPSAEDGEILVAAMQDSDRYVRQMAIGGLGELGDQQYTGQIAAQLRDSDADVRYRAAIALGDIGGTEARRALRAAADDPDTDVRQAIDRILESAITRT